MRCVPTSNRLLAVVVTVALAGLWAGCAQAADLTAYVADSQAGTITSVDLATGALGSPVQVGSDPVAIAITPDGTTAYVAVRDSSDIVPVNLLTGTALTPISLGDKPTGIAITPDGKVAYVISDNGTTWPITLANRGIGNPSRIPANSDAIAIAPSGRFAYITNVADATIAQLALPGGSSGQPIGLGNTFNTPDAIAITPDGTTAWVASNLGDTIMSVNLAHDTLGNPIPAGSTPTAMALTADGSTAYVTDLGSGMITPIDLTTGTAGTPIAVGGQPSAIALAPNGVVIPNPVVTGGGTGTVSSPPTTIGNQQLTLTLSAPTSTTRSRSAGGSAGQLCHARGSMLRATLTRKMLRHGARLALRYIQFTLGKQVKRATRLPATVRLSLKGLKAGMHALAVRAFFTEKLAARASGRGQRGRLSVTVSRKLRMTFRVC